MWLAAGFTDMREGLISLTAKAQAVLERNPFRSCVEPRLDLRAQFMW
ncbi:hypothetical protein PAMC26577_02110 [Caballeronia sordidicola]|uniref:Uncharacterized protein n=1 Tax=Caballeronia sordidicola TaxID=196367 RepID=A0A242N7Y5_CABSO|nr:hypothetical protein PAMC26577_02110 [Caballeronia sordidicola]